MAVFEGGAALPVTTGGQGPTEATAAQPVYIVSGGPVIGQRARRVVVVTSGPVEGGAAIPVYDAGASALYSNEPALPVYVVSGSLGGGAAPVTPFLLDTFIGVNGTNLTAHTGEIGATWAKGPSSSADEVIQSNRVYHAGGAFSRPTYYSSGVPSGADYDVTAIIRVVSNADQVLSIAGRMATGAETYYSAEYNNYHGDAPANWQLTKVVAGARTVLGAFDQTLTVGQDYTLLFKCRDALKELYIDGVQRVTSADNAITAAGRVGIAIYSDTAGDPEIGYHVDSITGQN